jgi:anti-sigma B factor antagonist
VLAASASQPRLVIDLSRVSFVDASGLGVLIDAAQWTRERRGALAVACNRPTLARLLRSKEVHRLVPVAETLEEALAALDPPNANGRSG